MEEDEAERTVLLVCDFFGVGIGLRERGRGERLTVAVGGRAMVGCAVVFCEDSGAVFGAEDYDGIDGE